MLLDTWILVEDFTYRWIFLFLQCNVNRRNIFGGGEPLHSFWPQWITTNHDILWVYLLPF